MSSSMGFAVGTKIYVSITGASPSAYDGSFVATVTGSTTFTYAPSGTPGTSATGTNMIAGFRPATVDASVGRVSALQDHGDQNILESYNYLGTNTVIQRNRPQPGVALTYVQQNGDTLAGTDGGDRYTGLDRFGRVVDQYWTNTNSPSSPTERFQYGYDADGNILFRNNLVSSSNSEVYAYDNLNRLTSFQRGTLNSTHTAITGTPSVSETWSLDALGNWTSGTSNTFNADNQITKWNGTTVSSGYDATGNIVFDPSTSNIYTYDAWNRLVQVNTATQTEFLTYDANGRLINNHTCTGPVTNSYYSSQWQDLEDDTLVSGTTTKRTYAWGQTAIDELVSRDEQVGSGSTIRVYAQQDSNNNVTALVDTGGTLLQRFQYDVYGASSVLTSTWNGTTDAYSWIWRFQSGRFDTISTVMIMRNRELDPSLGSWLQKDPLSYIDSPNLYQVMAGNPVVLTDPFGTDTLSDLGPPPPDSGPTTQPSGGGYGGQPAGGGYGGIRPPFPRLPDFKPPPVNTPEPKIPIPVPVPPWATPADPKLGSPVPTPGYVNPGPGQNHGAFSFIYNLGDPKTKNGPFPASGSGCLLLTEKLFSNGDISLYGQLWDSVMFNSPNAALLNQYTFQNYVGGGFNLNIGPGVSIYLGGWGATTPDHGKSPGVGFGGGLTIIPQ